MKTARMRLVCLGAMLAIALGVALADNDKPIDVADLPQAAQQLLSKEFSGKKVAMAKVETGVFEKSYEVVFTDGDKVEFDKSGNWTEVKCKQGVVPSSIVPTQIASYVKTNYPGQTIRSIEYEAKEYEIKLSGGLEITFNKKFKVVDID